MTARLAPAPLCTGIMRAWRVLAGALLAMLLAGGCQDRQGHSGFLEGSQGVAPVQFDYRGKRPATRISDTGKAVVIVYTHGNRRPRRREDCGDWPNQVPPSLRALHGEHILLYYHCSSAVDRLLPRLAGNWIFRRADELADIVEDLHASGVAAGNIYLAGHSAGGWSSLMAARDLGDRVGGVIAFAPAFAGPRSEEQRYPRWRREIRPAQIEHLLQAERIRALVFAYEDDPFERPQDLAFLADAYPDSVELVGYHCGSGHVTHLRDCQEQQTTRAILAFMGRAVDQSRTLSP